jgi:hypothetical protein
VHLALLNFHSLVRTLKNLIFFVSLRVHKHAVPLTELNGTPTWRTSGNGNASGAANNRRSSTNNGRESSVVVEELFHACKQKSPCLERIQSLVQEFPAAARARRYRNYFPVTAAITSGQHASLPVVKYLVHQYPQAIELVVSNDKSGTKEKNLLLHLALWSNKGLVPLDVLQYLLELAPRLASVPDYTGWLPLHVACKTYSSSSRSSVQVGSRSDSGVDGTSNQQKRRLEIIQALVRAFPDSVLARTHDGRLPLDVLLHDACRGRYITSSRYNNLVVSPSPPPPPPPQCALESVTLAATGYPPVHFACRYNGNVKTIKYLLKLNPNAVFTPTLDMSRDNDIGLLPLHCACLAIATCIDAMKTASPSPSSSGGVLSCWTRTTTSALRVLQLLLKHNPHAVSVKTVIHGETPLHCTCRATACCSGIVGDHNKDDFLSLLDIIQFLVATCPSSVDFADNIGRLPGQVLCVHSSRHAGCDCLYFLLRLYPQAILTIKRN